MDLVKQIGNKKYGIRPPLFQSPCPICGKEVTTGTDKRSSGFRKQAHKRHVFSCYENELIKLGLKEVKYNSKVNMRELKSIITLSKKQKEIISLMRQGWGLAYRHGMVRPSYPRKSIWIQEGGIGKGGRVIKIKDVTLMELAQKKLIERTDAKFSDTNYQLTGLGKTCSM